MSEKETEDAESFVDDANVDQTKVGLVVESKKETIEESIEMHLEPVAERNDVQQSEIKSLRDTVAVLNRRCEELQREKANLIEELERTKLSLQAESEALANKTDDSKELETLQQHSKKLELEVAALISERDSLECSLEELDEQHQQAIDQLIQSRDSISAQYKEVVAQNDALSLQLKTGNESEGVLDAFFDVLSQAEVVNYDDVAVEDKFEHGLNAVKGLAQSYLQAKSTCNDLMGRMKYLENVEQKFQISEAENLRLQQKVLHLENKLLKKENSAEQMATNVLQDQVNELQAMIGDLENQLREKENQLGSMKDILKVYKENLDPERETGKNRESELQSKLDAQVKNEELERARMMAVLNDKARENSSLKAEVHRLVNVVSAERAALTKLQRDCEQLAAVKNFASGHNDDQLTKQAVQNLSRMVSDRDLEIEALREKNRTLTSVIQDSDPNSAAVCQMLRENEELKQKVSKYQVEHDQIINLLNQKHSESVAYHGELVKLNNLMQEERVTKDALREQNDDLSKKLGEKQKAYLAAQNESVALQGKVLQLEQQQENLQVRYNRLLQEEEHVDSALANQDDEGLEDKNVTAVTLRIDKDEWTAKLQELDKCRHLLQDRDRLLYEKDCQVHEKMRQIENSKELFKRKEEELSVSSQRHNHLSNQLESSRAEAQSVRDQNTALRSRLEDHRSEIALLKETNSALSVTLQEREFELKALRGKVDTLSRLVEQQRPLNNPSCEEEEKNNIKKLLSDSEEMRQRAQGFQAERDQTLLALNHKQRENDFIQEQMKGMKEREDRLLRELERLRSHLLHVEESYTQEALRSEEREKELRTRLALSEDRIQMATSNHSMASQHASLQVESLQEQLRSVMEQRDSVLGKCSNLEDQIAQKSAALRTLQVVLEQLQEEKRREVMAYQTQCENAIIAQRDECLRLGREVRSLETQLLEANEALSAASRLTEQLDRKEETIQMLKEHVEFQETALEKVKVQLEVMKNSSDITVDKTIIKNLMVGYITVPVIQQKEVLRIIATVLDFNKEERERTGLDEVRIGWISWLSSKPPPSPLKNRSVTQQSLTEAFVRFLESESQPRPKIKLSYESLTSNRDSRPKRSINQITAAASSDTAVVTPSSNSQLQNPFVVSLMPSVSDTRAVSLKPDPSSNLLMKPMSSALPTFVRLTDSSSTNDILRDVLK